RNYKLSTISESRRPWIMSCDRLAKNQSVPELPCSTSTALSSKTVASGPLTFRKVLPLARGPPPDKCLADSVGKAGSAGQPSRLKESWFTWRSWCSKLFREEIGQLCPRQGPLIDPGPFWTRTVPPQRVACWTASRVLDLKGAEVEPAVAGQLQQ